MELRQLVTDREREIFAQRVSQARAKRDAGAREAERSRLYHTHLAFANLYGLFEHPDEPAERMISGFTAHDLEMLPQSYSRPDLTYLPPRLVAECGEFWSVSGGGGLLARRGALIALNALGIRAVLIYAMLKPWDTAESFARVAFERVGEPIEFPYARTMDGGPVTVQAMVLQGENMRSLMERVAAAGFEVFDDGRRVRFDNPLPFQPSVDRPTVPRNRATAPAGLSMAPQNGHSA
ncbi:MAG: hypothetical protein WA005_11280 [Candidatus Binataceae bacterium]